MHIKSHPGLIVPYLVLIKPKDWAFFADCMLPLKFIKNALTQNYSNICIKDCVYGLTHDQNYNMLLLQPT